MMSDLFSLKNYLDERSRLVENALDLYLPGKDTLPADLHGAMRYSVFAGGKRIRPVLMMAACEAVGGDPVHALPPACAIEMIHSYSLIHDDLPAMDDDDYRRGKPTNHKVYGEAIAILAGDALLTEAFLLLSGPVVKKNLRPEQVMELIELLAKSSGSRGMVGGQVVDMESEGRQIDLPTLEYIHTRKTGALLLAAIEMGCVVGQASVPQRQALVRYGEAVGLAFQVTDDILDITADQDHLGKDVGSDAQRGKATYPAFLGLEGARERAAELRDIALSAIAPLPADADPLRAIADYIVERSS